MATQTGKRIVAMVWEDLKPSNLLSEQSIHNAVAAVLAIGGSTNAIIHLIALARRAGLPLDLENSTRWRARRRCWRTSGRPAPI